MLIQKNSVISPFKANVNSMNPDTGIYSDPLMRWPLRGAAFTNEVGEALRPLIGNYATLSWVPALLYIGADVYDKYKNDKTDYSPDSRRCLKQAVFQGMASIFLPLVAVKFGQKLFSLFGMKSDDKITYNAKEHIIQMAQQFVANGKMRAYKDDDSACAKEFLAVVSDNLNFKKQEESASNPFKKLSLYIEEGLSSRFDVNTKKNLDKYSTKTINSLIQMRKDLLNPDSVFENSLWYSNYKIAKQNGQTNNVAVKSVLNKYLQTNTLKGKAIKTMGGFLALGIAIKPIDRFVENVLIGKIVGPGIDKTKRPS